MLVAAALVPETALLVPGAAGASSVLDEERTAALEAVRRIVAAVPDRVVVVAPGTAADGTPDLLGQLRPTLVAAGIADAVLRWGPVAGGSGSGSGPGSGEGGESAGVGRRDVVVQDVAASVGLLLLAQGGWTGVTRVLRVPPGDPAELRERGRAVAQEDRRVAVVLVASLSARRGPDGPLADDVRAAAVDAQVLADLQGLDGEARDRLAAVPSALAAELALSAWAPWQVLLGAAEQALGAGGSVHGELLRTSAPFGATYAVLHWAVG